MGVELLFNSVEFGVPKQLPREFQTVETRCGREDHTRPRGSSESPDGVDPNIRRTRKTQRDGHNSGVKIWSLCSVSSILSHANPWTTLSNPCNKVRGEYFSKEVFLRPWCVVYHCVSIYPVYICIQHSYHLAFSSWTFSASMWCIHTVVLA